MSIPQPQDIPSRRATAAVKVGPVAGGMPRAAPRPPGRARRTVEVTGAVVLLMLLAPLFLVIAVAIRVTSPGPALYHQTRVGRNRRSGRDRRGPASGPVEVDRRRLDRRTIASAGQLFRIVKFRTMVDGAESATGPRWAAEDDGRITPVGGVLRRYRLDELPQVVNVVRGDMAFIGPRPERPFFVDRFLRTIPGYRERLTVPPGITGLAQVEHCYDASLEDVYRKLRYDREYIRTRCLKTDAVIVCKTLRVILSGAGAH